MIECLLCKLEALSSNPCPSPAPQKKKKDIMLVDRICDGVMEPCLGIRSRFLWKKQIVELQSGGMGAVKKRGESSTPRE
jgi:hypothetical protein